MNICTQQEMNKYCSYQDYDRDPTITEIHTHESGFKLFFNFHLSTQVEPIIICKKLDFKCV